MLFAAKCGALIALLQLALIPVHAAVSVTDLAQPVSIAGQWQFRIGDDPTWAAADLDDSDWQSTAVPAHAPDDHSGYSGMLWYRHTLRLDLSQPSVHSTLGALAITLGNVMSAYEIYAGGERIGRIGKMPPTPEAIYDQRQTWAVPVSAVGADGKLVLALRVWRNPVIGGQWQTGPNFGDFLIGNVGELREQLLRKALIPKVVLAVLYLVLGLYHLLVAHRNPVLKEFFWFGLFSIVFAGYTFETSQSKFFLDISYLWHKKIEFLLLYLAPMLFSKTLLAVTRTSSNWLVRGFYVVFGLYFASALVLPGDTVLRTLSSFQYLAAAWAISMAAIMAWRAFLGSRSARGVMVLLLLLTAAVFNDLILESALVGTGNVLYIVYALMLLFMALMMAERYTDILKQLESSVEQRTAQLVKANYELEAAVETKGNFLANMSHEMRTPMNAILGLTHLGLKTQLSNQQRDYFTKVEQSAEDLQGIIDSILDFSRLEKGQLESVSEPFRLRTMIEEVARIWADPVAQAGLELVVVVDPKIPQVLTGDARRLKQVLGNFISNAAKFTEGGQVELSLNLLHEGEQSVRLRFSVSDTGVGIADDQRDKLFAAFSQVDNTMTREFGGTGLGLSIAQRLVELMGGSIDLESTPGVGSTFSFDLTLPITEATAETVDDSVELDLIPIRGARILLVDDSDLNLQVAGELLRQAKLQVDIARDGKEAIDKVKLTQYDCVLMDVQMPVMDGYTATEIIRSMSEHKDLPILAMTANAMPQDRAKGAEAGMNAYIPKPIDPNDLYRTLLQWVAPGQRDYDEESFAVSESTERTTGDLPEVLPGINISEGMNRLGGNAALYLSLLQDLCKDYADAVERIVTMLDGGNTDDAGQLAHKLRGIANNLGAVDIGAAAESIEVSLKSGEAPVAGAIPQLARAIALTVESWSILASLMTSDAPASKLGEDQRQALFAELLLAVKENNPEALELIEKLLADMTEDAEGYSELAAVGDALNMYDFSGAAALLPSGLPPNHVVD